MLHNPYWGEWGLKQWPSLQWHIMPVIYVNPVSVKTKRKQVESNRMLICVHQTNWNLLLALTWWLAVNNPISFPQSGPQPVFGHACFCCGCETSLRENLRVERVPLIPGTDKKTHRLLAVGTAICQSCDTTALSKSRRKRLIERMASWPQKSMYHNRKYHKKKET